MHSDQTLKKVSPLSPKLKMQLPARARKILQCPPHVTHKYINLHTMVP